MPRRLSEAQLHEYRREGFLSPLPVLSPIEAQRYRAACDELEGRLGGKPRTIEVRQMHLHFAWAHALATHPAILDAVEDVLGPDLLIWATELFAKHPHDATVAIGWHRDQPYLGLTGGSSTTAWIALSDSTRANGCMRALSRSADPLTAAPAAQGCTAREAASIDWGATAMVDVALRAGEMSLHAADVMHGSRPNQSDAKRVGFAIRFVTPDARPIHSRPPVVVARGRDRYEHFSVTEPAPSADETVAVAGLQASARGHLDAVLENLKRTGR
jgi:ectoine hydroxylase-related dioxygenase (phytanoyl-CoA dioxygenase family)